MSIFTLDPDGITGHDGIDAAHQQIADVSNSLTASIDSRAPFGEVYKLYQRFADVMREHFELEEALLARFRDVPEVAVHINRHHENHAFFRDALNYADGKFQERIATGKVPNVVELLPKEYFEELIDLDLEMAALLRKHESR